MSEEQCALAIAFTSGVCKVSHTTTSTGQYSWARIEFRSHLENQYGFNENFFFFTFVLIDEMQCGTRFRRMALDDKMIIIFQNQFSHWKPLQITRGFIFLFTKWSPVIALFLRMLSAWSDQDTPSNRAEHLKSKPRIFVVRPITSEAYRAYDLFGVQGSNSYMKPALPATQS